DGAEVLEDFSLPEFSQNFEEGKGVTNILFRSQLEAKVRKTKRILKQKLEQNKKITKHNIMAKKVLLLVGDYVEDYEAMVPFQAMESVGIKVDTIAPDRKSGDTVPTAIHDFTGDQTYKELRGHNFAINKDFDSVHVEDYD